jgi:hypothetical protein
MTHGRKVAVAMLGAAPAFVIVYLAWRYAQVLSPHVSSPADDVASRLAFTVRWLLLPGLTLLAGIHGAARRGFFPDAIEGTRTPLSQSLEINLRYNTNTVEQVVVATIAWLGLAVTLPIDQLIMIPVAAILFAIGRIAFWVGYLFHPLARAFGMTLTAVPTLVAYLWLVWQFVSR